MLPNEKLNWVSVIIENSYCWHIPLSGNQIHCGESLHNGFNQQYCSGQIENKVTQHALKYNFKSGTDFSILQHLIFISCGGGV